MTPDHARPIRPAAKLLARGSVGLLFAVAVGIALVQVLLRPPWSDLQALGLYMLMSAVVTAGLGAAVVTTMDRANATTLRARIALSAVVGALVGLLNVLVVSKLMFVSTAHDLRLLAALVGFSSLVSLVFSSWVAARLSTQLDAVARRIRGLASGDYASRLDLGSAGEIARQAQELNQLAELLQGASDARAALDRERRNLVVAISHDLRTPLASLRAMAEALADGVVDSPSEVGRYHATMRKEVERLTQMVEDLFQVAQLDAGALPLDLHPISLQDVAAEVADGMQARAHAAGIALAFEASDPLPPIQMDGALMERAVANLVSNAIEHTPSGGTISVSTALMAGTHRLEVRDTGEGIAPSEYERVWEPFYRADPSRTRASRATDAGAGLGLAIVRGVVEAHGGTVVLTSSAAGSTFTIALPAHSART